MPTVADLISGAERRLADALTERSAHTEKLTDLRAKLDAGDAAVTEDVVRGVLDERGKVDATIEELRKRVDDLKAEQRADEAAAALQREIVPTQARGYDQQGRVVAEPSAYNPGNARDFSFFSDAFAASTGAVGREARERLERNEKEYRLTAAADQVQRATTTGSYAGLVVPQYLVDLAANVLRNGRPFLNAMTRLPIPEQGMSFLLPRATTGVSEASQATENSAVSNTDQVWTNVTVPVASIAGQQQVSRQSLERGTPGIDQLIYADLVAAFAAEADRQAFVGTGASGQMTGLNPTSGINTATAFGAAVTVSTFYSKVAGQIAAIAGAGTMVRPSLIVMHPRRWGWATLQVDSSNRPLVTPTANGPYNAFAINANPGAYGADGNPTETAGFDIVGSLHGLAVTTDANIPTNLGGGSTEDVVFIVDTRHALLFEEGDGMPRQLRFEQIQVSGTAGFGATVTLAAYGYMAATFGRYPQAFGRVGGADSTGANGLQAPTY